MRARQHSVAEGGGARVAGEAENPELEIVSQPILSLIFTSRLATRSRENRRAILARLFKRLIQSPSNFGPIL